MLNTAITFTTTTLARRLQIIRDEKGAGIVEYLLLVLFIALAMIAALALFSDALSDAFSGAADSVSG